LNTCGIKTVPLSSPGVWQECNTTLTMRLVKYILLLCLIEYVAGAYATDTALEKQWSDALTKSAADSEVVWLDMQGGKFLSLYLGDKTGNPQGAAIILHALGGHPDWPGVISPLRKTLPAYGWATLSLQMPVMPITAPLERHVPLLDEVPERIKAAISYLQSIGINNIVLIGHGLGAAMGAAFLAANDGSGIKAFIGISMVGYQGIDPRMYSPASLEKIKLPILDIYGGRDLDNVRFTSTARADAARKAGGTITQNQELAPFKQSGTAQSVLSKKSGFISYRQFEIPGADHSFNGFEDMLNKRIIGWLKQYAAGTALTKPASELKNQAE